jgi:cell division protein FtsI/penicillin-binding protein 2
MQPDIFAIHRHRWHILWACLVILIAFSVGSFLLGRQRTHRPDTDGKPALTDRNGVTLLESVATHDGMVRFMPHGEIYCPLLRKVERGIASGAITGTGGEIRLTLDLTLQKILLNECAEAFRSYHPECIEALLADPVNGEIRAAVSLREDPESVLTFEELIPGELFDYYPGSAFKPFAAAAYLEAFPDRIETPIDCLQGKLTLGSDVIRDQKPRGELTPRQILLNFSHIGIARMADDVGDERFRLLLRKYGFGKPSLDLPFEDSCGMMKPSAYTSPQAELAYLSIGHRVIVTPLQMAMAYGAIANGGLLMPARILGAGNRSSSLAKRIFPEETARFIQGILREAVAGDYGEALARVDGMEVAGLPGTSQFSPPEDNSGNKSVYASYAGYFPADHPRYVCVIVIKGADIVHSFNYGSLVTAPIFSCIAKKVAAQESFLNGAEKKSPH